MVSHKLQKITFLFIFLLVIAVGLSFLGICNSFSVGKSRAYEDVSENFYERLNYINQHYELGNTEKYKINLEDIEIINGDKYIGESVFESVTQSILDDSANNDGASKNSRENDGEINALCESIDLIKLDDACEDNGINISETEGELILTNRFASKRIFAETVYACDLPDYNSVEHISGLDNLHAYQFESEFDAMRAMEIMQNDERIASVFEDAITYTTESEIDAEEINATIQSKSKYYTWGASDIGADVYDTYLQGLGVVRKEVVIAVLDTGIYSEHLIFKDRLLQGKNFGTDDLGDENIYTDGNGHGTHVAGTIADLTDSNVKILPIKVLNNDGNGSVGYILSGLQYVRQLKADGVNIIAVNMSLGAEIALTDSGYSNHAQALIDTYNANILPIVAAGNDSSSTYNWWPANVPCAITVSALVEDKDDVKKTRTIEHANYSNFGSFVDISAPGTMVLSASNKFPSQYVTKSGTSMATPHIAGLVALIYSNPNLNFDVKQAEVIIKGSAIDMGEVGFDIVFGYGMANVANLLNYKYVNLKSTGQGISSKEGVFKVANSSNLDIIFTPNLGYETLIVKVNGEEQVNLNHYLLKSSYLLTYCEIEVVYSTEPRKYHVTSTSGANGVISTSQNTVPYGGEIIFTITPNEGYDIDALTINGDIASVVKNKYTIQNVMADIVANVTFKKKTFEMFAIINGNGSINQTLKKSVEYNSSITYVFTPDVNNMVQAVYIDGVNRGIISSYEFENITSNHKIEVYFEMLKYNVIIDKVGRGTVSPWGINKVNIGENLTITITAGDGYEISSIMLDGEEQTITTSFELTNVQSDRKVEITFTQKLYQITSSAGDNGSIYPLGVTNIYGLEKLRVSLNPYENYQIDKVFIDGIERVVANDYYEFSNVSDNHTIRVTFKLIDYTISLVVGENGAVNKPTSYKVTSGDNSQITITPAEYYEIKFIKINNVRIENSNILVINNVKSDLSVEITFVKQTRNVQINMVGGGKVYYNDVNLAEQNFIKVNAGDNLLLRFEANFGFEFRGYILNDGVESKYTSITLYNILNNQEIQVFFDVKSYEITTSVANGQITNMGLGKIYEGAAVSYGFIANVGYELESVVIDGSKKDLSINRFNVGDEIFDLTSSSLTITNVCTNHNLNVFYKKSQFDFEIIKVGQGEILGAVEKALYGDKINLTINPNTGYELKSMSLNDELLPIPTTNKFDITITTDTQLKITFAKIQFELMVASEGNGSITPNGVSKVDYGQTIELNILPNAKYTLDKLVVNNEIVNVTNNKYSIVTYQNFDIKAFFRQDYVTIKSSSDGAGVVLPNAINEVSYGGDLTLNFQPDEGFEVYKIIVDTVEVDYNANSYTFRNSITNHTVIVRFRAKQYDLVATASVNGTISPSGHRMAEYGSSFSYEFIPNTGYEIDVLTINNQVVENDKNVLVLNHINENKTINVTFKVKTLIISASVDGSNGTISNLGDIAVKYGESITYDITPNAQYEIKEILVNGKNATVQNKFEFIYVVSNNTIVVSFKEKIYNVIFNSTIDGGSLKSLSTKELKFGEKATYEITPKAGYVVDEVFVNSTKVAVRNNRFSIEVKEDMDIVATYKKNDIWSLYSNYIIFGGIILILLSMMFVTIRKIKILKSNVDSGGNLNKKDKRLEKQDIFLDSRGDELNLSQNNNVGMKHNFSFEDAKNNSQRNISDLFSSTDNQSTIKSTASQINSAKYDTPKMPQLPQQSNSTKPTNLPPRMPMQPNKTNKF